MCDVHPPYDAFYFDCDSTLVTIEGIDWLAEELDSDSRDALARLTSQAMNGETPLEEVYARRIDTIAPSSDRVRALGHSYVESLVTGAIETVQALLGLGKEVGVVSGGLRPAVVTVASHLGISEERVHAVDVSFGACGAYRGFDGSSPLVTSNGKIAVLRDIRQRAGSVVFIGDGVTDLKSMECVDLFIGFGGVVNRESVRSEAEGYVGEPDLRGVLDLCLSDEERLRWTTKTG